MLYNLLNTRFSNLVVLFEKILNRWPPIRRWLADYKFELQKLTSNFYVTDYKGF